MRSDGPEGEPEGDTGDDAVIGRAFRRGLLVLGLGALGTAGAFALWPAPEPPPPVPVAAPPSAPAPATRAAVSAPALPFADVTSSAGLDFDRFNGARGARLLPETMGGGVTFFDHEGDGDADLLVVQGRAWPGDPAPTPPPTPRLWRNDGGRFTDITTEAGLAHPLQGMGAFAADADGDGHRDLLLTGVNGARFLRGTGGQYREATAEAGLDALTDGWTTAAVFFDADGDADLDLAVARYVRWSAETDLALESTLDGRHRAYGPPTQFEGAHLHLFRNDGGARYTAITRAAGLEIERPGTGRPLAKTLGLTAADVDFDGRLDLVAANDTVQNLVFVNRGGGRFEERGVELGVAFDAGGRARGAMGIDAADFADDGRLGIAIGNFANEMAALYTRTPGAPTFVDTAIAEGLGAPTRRPLKFGLFFFDADLDGRLDLLLANGHLEPEIGRFQPGQTYEQPAQLFWQRRPDEPGPRFVERPAETTGDLAHPRVGRGAAFADVDGDGDLDVALGTPAGPVTLLRNDQQTGHHWLRVRLRGRPPNREAIGALVSVTTGGRTQRRLVMPFRSYLSQVETTLTFGLGPATRVDGLDVRWPDGRTQTAPLPAVDRTVEVDEE
jgi:hypothetical protein